MPGRASGSRSIRRGSSRTRHQAWMTRTRTPGASCHCSTADSTPAASCCRSMTAFRTPERAAACDSYRGKNRDARSCHARAPAGTRRSAERSASVAFVSLGRRCSLLSPRDRTGGARPSGPLVDRLTGHLAVVTPAGVGRSPHRHPWRQSFAPAAESPYACSVAAGRRETSKRPSLLLAWPSGTPPGRSPCSRSGRAAALSGRSLGVVRETSPARPEREPRQRRLHHAGRLLRRPTDSLGQAGLDQLRLPLAHAERHHWERLRA
jgi:hypothetical protein